MYILSFVNQILSPSHRLLLVSDDFSRLEFIDHDFPVNAIGATGICFYKKNAIVAYQDGSIIILDQSLKYVSSYKSPQIKDPHSLLVIKNNLYVSSTGSNTIIQLKLSNKCEILTESIYWRYPDLPDYNYDYVHINSICYHKGSLLVSLFGLREKGEKWSNNQSGEIIDTTNNKLLATELSGPHSLCSENDKVVFCNSNSNEILALDKTVLVKEEYGYLRGLLPSQGDLLYVINSRRKLQTSNFKNFQGRIGFSETINEVTSLKKYSPKGIVSNMLDLTIAGKEIYEFKKLPAEFNYELNEKLTIKSRIIEIEKSFVSIVSEYNLNIDEMKNKYVLETESNSKLQDNLESRIISNNETITQLTEQIQYAKTETIEANEIIQLNKLSQNQLKSKNQSLTQRERSLEEENQEIKAKITKLENDNIKLTQDIDKLTYFEENLTSENQKLVRKNEELDQIIGDLNRTIEDLSKSKEELGRQKEELYNKNEQLTSQISSLYNEITEYLDELAALETNSKLQKNELLSVIDLYKGEIESLVKRNDIEVNTASELKATILQNKTKIHEIEYSNSQLKKFYLTEIGHIKDSYSWKIGYFLTRFPAFFTNFYKKGFKRVTYKAPKISKVKSGISNEFSNRNNQAIITVPPDLGSKSKIVVSINPDLKSKFGHFLKYDLIIKDTLSNSQGFISLSNRNNIITGYDFIVPSFTNNSWNIGRQEQVTFERQNLFETELVNSLDQLSSKYSNSEIIVFLYCGSINHAAIISKLAPKFESIEFRINLFWEHFNYDFIKNNIDFYTNSINAFDEKVKIYYDSEEQRDFMTSRGIPNMDVWPAFSLLNTELISDNTKLSGNIFFPGNMRRAKGFEIAVNYTNHFYSKNSSNQVIIREQINASTTKFEKSLLAKIHPQTKILKGNLSDKEFIQHLLDADIIVLPYKTEEFKSRTSGLYCDSTYLGKIIVATDGTWMANRITKFKNGVTFKEDDVASLDAAINEVYNNYSCYAKRASKAAAKWRTINSINKLTSVFATVPVVKQNIIYFPGFETQEDFENHFYRLIWYVNPVIEYIDKIYMPVKSVNDISVENCSLPSNFDSYILELLPRVSSKIELISNTKKSLEDYVKASSVILQNDIALTKRSDLDKSILKKASYNNLWRVDTSNERNEASFYSRVSMYLNPNIDKDIQSSLDTFKQWVSTINEEKVYIFGTGPSLEDAMLPKFNFDDGLCIVCNSMVKNESLLEKLKPRLIVAADPIFHAGNSSYAAAFRKDLMNTMDKYDAYFITPMRDLKLYQKNLALKYRSKIIGVPFENMINPNFDLLSNFVVKSYPNVLTMFLIPLASTIGKEVNIMGCDGKEVRDNKYFWAHHKKSQFNNKMSEIKEVHPAFFNISYEDYYENHIKQLEDMIEAGMKNNITYYNLTKSFIPILLKIQKHV